MANLLDEAVEVARRLPLQNQNEIAQIILQLTGNDSAEIYHLSPEERTAITESKVQAARGEFASDKEIEAIWDK